MPSLVGVGTWTCIHVDADTSEANPYFIWRDLMNRILAEFGTKFVLLVAKRRCRFKVMGKNGIFLALPQIAQLSYESRLWFWEYAFGEFGNETACRSEEKKDAATRQDMAKLPEVGQRLFGKLGREMLIGIKRNRGAMQ